MGAFRSRLQVSLRLAKHIRKIGKHGMAIRVRNHLLEGGFALRLQH